MLYPTAMKLKQDYRCALCWGPLDLFLSKEQADSYDVLCAREKVAHAQGGYVSNHFVNEARSKDAEQYHEVMRGLRKAGVIEQSTDTDIKHQLGY